MRWEILVKPIFMTILLFAAALSALGQERPRDLISQRVTFTLPTHWKIQTQENSPAVGKIQMIIPYPETASTPHSANVAIVANTIPEGVTIKEIGDQVYNKNYPGMVVVNDIPDGREWRTVVWTAQSGVPYVALNRFGCSNGIALEVLLAFPLLENGDQKWIEKAVSDFNAFCETLKIDGKNANEAKVHLGTLPDGVKPKVIRPKSPKR